MAQPKSFGPECVYGKPCYAICKNPNCRKPGLICEPGFHSKDQCSLFHHGCQKILWSEIDSMVYDNPNLRSEQFAYLRDKVDLMFYSLIEKIKSQHAKFKLWVKTYGFSIQVMKFIKNLTQGSYNLITGNYLHPILTEMYTPKKVEFPKIIESQVVALTQNLLQVLDSTSDLYLKPGSTRKKNVVQSIQTKTAPLVFTSKIISEIASIQRLFENKISSFQLMYRASENGFSIKQFHKKCDGVAGTVLLVQTEYSKIIGGYTPIPWSSAKKQWAADKSLKSFIFSLNMRQKFTLNLAQFAIANNPQKGPTFGCCDICIVDNGNKQRSNAQFPISYNNGKYIRSPECSFAFTGHPKGQFLTKEWEVFKIEFE